MNFVSENKKSINKSINININKNISRNIDENSDKNKDIDESIKRNSDKSIKAHIILSILSVSVCYAFACNAYASPNVKSNKVKAHLERQDILHAIPSDCVGAYVSFDASSSEQKAFGMLASLISAAGISGALNTNQQIIADMALVTLNLAKYPHAIFVRDISAKRLNSEDSFALAEISGGIIIKAKKDKHREILALLKKIIDHYFTSADAKITWIGKGRYRHQRLTAKELPKWASWEWISLDNYFVFVVGKGVLNETVETITKKRESITSNYLIKLANEHDTDIANRVFMGYIDVIRLRNQLSSVMKNTFENVLDALDASELETWLFSAGFTGRAFISKIYLQWPTGAEMGYLTDMISPSNPLYKAIPPQASSYGVSYINVSEGMKSIVSTYLQSRNAQKREKLIRNYNKLMKRAGLSDIDKLIFRHLGPVMIIHDWPAHPLGWPFAKTFVIQHDGSEELKRNWKKVLPVWQMLMRKISHNDKIKNAPIDLGNIFSVQLDCTDDNIWFIHLGPIVLAAAGLQNQFLVISHSPLAVRVNIKYLNSVFHSTNTTNIANATRTSTTKATVTTNTTNAPSKASTTGTAGTTNTTNRRTLTNRHER